ncbi:Uncharacterized domain associated with phage/plasmid primase [Desulfatibacillum alkenivorans DSM 16219]|jgi:phage/plasmid primase-like uncharacterized protein|uniref:Uncharacterized domain associated with phage/plasmid primase n=1 Tax=Desulfatibacillum alkenivorans DSM 16219 TaxID=1121393 RepID=A0A1M6YKQ7_9BACT|nr:AAA family ATPase [Desulfatibacillum alkenivorans]SHL18894.1 Uncharacterized domain associated with phage/plasmid primase [Desulfatibacillum alkenivorans DSM 16219]
MIDFNQAGPQIEDPDDYTSAAPDIQIGERNPIDAFLAYMAEQGYYPEGGIKPDGALHRFRTEEDDSSGKSGWYVFHVDGIPAGAFGDWRSVAVFNWSVKSRHEMTQQELEGYTAFLARKKELYEQEQAKAWEAARIRAEKILGAAHPVPISPSSHQYTQTKNVQVHAGVRVDDSQNLIIPLIDFTGTVRTLQFISMGGKKLYLPGGLKKGCFFPIQGVRNDVYYICEGYATGASINEATGQSVFVAFDTSGLEPVARGVRERYPDKQIVICADNDQWTTLRDGTHNPGVVKAQQAAEAVGATVIVPDFGELRNNERPTDFNDLATRNGISEVTRQLTQRPKLRVDLDMWTLDAYRGDPPERTWLVNNVFPMEAPTLFAARGDTGKGMLTLDLALKVASEHFSTPLEPQPYAFGSWVDAHGTAVILTAEDDKGEVHRRLNNLDPDFAMRSSCGNRLRIIPLPNSGGPISLVTLTKDGPGATPIYYEIKEQLTKIRDLKLVVIDPLASFAALDINADPAAGQFVMGLLSSLATETGAAVILVHHMGKTAKPIVSADQARDLIRGTTAIVDGARCAFALWPDNYDRARRICAKLGLDHAPNRVYRGAVVKSNGPSIRKEMTFVRSDNGLLRVRDADLEALKVTPEDERQILLLDIIKAAENGRPFAYSGGSGLAERREELSPEIRSHSRDKIRAIAKELLEAGTIGKCIHNNNGNTKWLDIPTGPFGMGRGEFTAGFTPAK